MAQTTLLDRAAIAQRGKHLEYFTIVWNSLEAIVAITAGAVAGSISLVGFGIDSLIEVTSGVTLLWRMASDANERRRGRVGKIRLCIAGAWFLALAAYGSYATVSTL